MNIKMKTKNMKTSKCAVRTRMKSLVRQLTVLIAVSGIWLNAEDLKMFNPQESYLVEGASIVLTLKVGEATVKFGSALQDSTTLTAANGAKFDRDRELPSGIRTWSCNAGHFVGGVRFF